MSAPCVLPVELIIRILSYLEPRNIIQLRTVSQYFRAISYDTSLWKSLYKNAPFLCPPAPHPSQSTASLERILVESARLARSWTTSPMRRVSLLEIPAENVRPPLKLICGRWLIVCHKAREFVLYDTDLGCKAHTPQVLWKCENQRVRGFDVDSMVSVEGQCVIYVLVGFVFGVSDASVLWNLLEFRLNTDTGELYGATSMDPDVSRSTLIRPGRQFGIGQSRFLFIPATPETLVFDTETKTFRKLPPLRVARDESLAELTRPGMRRMNNYIQMVFTGSRLISIHYFGEDEDKELTALVQVFIFPPIGTPDKTDLQQAFFRLTHEGLFQTMFPINTKVMKPWVNPVDGTTTIRLLNPSAAYPGPTIVCVDLVLLEALGDKVLPITIKREDIELPGLESLKYRHDLHICLDTSYDGPTARGFVRAGFPSHDLDSRTREIMKFELNFSLDWEPRIAHSKFQPPEWSADDEPNTDIQSTQPPHNSAMLDGTRGKLCYLTYISGCLVVHVAHVE